MIIYNYFAIYIDAINIVIKAKKNLYYFYKINFLIKIKKKIGWVYSACCSPDEKSKYFYSG